MVYQLVNNGDVPDEDYFNALMNQGIIPCTSGTRPTPTHDGMTVWETDTNLHATWDGAAWIYPYAPTYIDYTPTFYSNIVSGTAIAGGSVVVTYSRYQLIRKKVHFYGHAQINTTTASGFGLSLPVAASQRLLSLQSIALHGPSGYATSFGEGHIPGSGAPFTRYGPVSNNGSTLNIVASGDTVHWNTLYETV